MKRKQKLKAERFKEFFKRQNETICVGSLEEELTKKTLLEITVELESQIK